MHGSQLENRTERRLGWSLLASLVFGIVAGASNADDKLIAPPYQMAGSNHVLIGVIWDEAAVRNALPPGITPVKEMTGGINIYQADRGSIIGPYQSAYYWVDIEGFDSPQGIKGRWMLAGVYGPQDVTSASLKEYYGLPVRKGTSRFEPTAEGKRAIGTLGGQDFITAEIKSVSEPCEAVAGLLNYPGQSAKTKKIAVNEIPFVGEVCKAEPVSVEVTAAAGDPFAAFPIAKVVWAAELKNGAFSFSRPVPTGK